MPKGRKRLLPIYERKRNERIKKNNEIFDSLGLKSIATSLRDSIQHKRATQKGKCSRGELDDDDYRPDPDDEDDDHDSDIELSPPRQSKNMKKKRYRTLDLENAIKGILEYQSDSQEGNAQGSIFWSPNDVYSRAIPTKKWGGRVPGCGFGLTPGSSGSTCDDSQRSHVVDLEEERRIDKETIRRLEERVNARDAEMNTLKEQVALLMRQQAQYGLNGPSDQTSTQACQRSSHASYDLGIF